MLLYLKQVPVCTLAALLPSICTHFTRVYCLPPLACAHSARERRVVPAEEAVTLVLTALNYLSHSEASKYILLQAITKKNIEKLCKIQYNLSF